MPKFLTDGVLDGRWEDYNPAAQDMGSGSQLVAQFQESWMAAPFQFMDRKSAQTKQALDAGGFEQLNRELDTSDLGLREHEIQYLIDEGVRDYGEAKALVLQERAAEERQRKLANQSALSNIATGFLAYAPQGILEYGLAKGMLRPLTALRAPAAARSVLARDIYAGVASEYTGSAIAAYIDPVDGVEQAINNGTLGAMMSATILAGVDAARWSAGRSKSAFSPTLDALMEDTRQNHAAGAAAAHQTAGLPVDTPVVPLDRDVILNEILPSRGIEATDENVHRFILGELDDGDGDALRFVEPRAENQADGTHFKIEPASLPPSAAREPQPMQGAGGLSRLQEINIEFQAKLGEMTDPEAVRALAQAKDAKAIQLEAAEGDLGRSSALLATVRGEAAAAWDRLDILEGREPANLRMSEEKVARLARDQADEERWNQLAWLEDRQAEGKRLSPEDSAELARLQAELRTPRAVEPPAEPVAPEAPVPPATEVPAGAATPPPPGAWVLRKRQGYLGAWEDVASARSQEDAVALLKELHPLSLGVDTFFDPTTWSWSRSRLLDLQEHYQPGGQFEAERGINAATQVERELALLEQEIGLLKRQREEVDNPALKRDLTQRIEGREARLEQQRNRRDLFVADRNIRGLAFGNSKVMQWMADKWFTKAGKAYKPQFPYWTLINDPALANTPSGVEFARLAEELMGTNGSQMFDPARRGRESVYARMKSRGEAHWASFYQQFFDAYGLSIGMGRGMTPSGAFFRSKMQQVEGFYRKVANRPATSPTRSIDQFERDVRDAHVARVQAQRGEGGSLTSGDPHVDAAVDAFEEMIEELGRLVRSVGGFGSQVEIAQRIEKLKVALREPPSEAYLDQPEFQSDAIAAHYAAFRNRYSQLSGGEVRSMEDQEADFLRDLGEQFGVPVTYVRLEDLSRIQDSPFYTAYPPDTIDGYAWSDGATTYIFNGTTPANPVDRMHVLLHEFGHAVDNTYWWNTPEATRAAVHQEFLAYRREFEGLPVTTEEMTAMAGPASMVAGGRSPEYLEFNSKDWTQRFDEWKAQQIAHWLKSDARPQSVVETYFAELAQHYREMLQEISSNPHMVDNPGMRQWLDDLWNGRVTPNIGIAAGNGLLPPAEQREPRMNPDWYVRQQLELAEAEKRLQQSKAREEWQPHFHRSYDKTEVATRSEEWKTLVTAWLSRPGGLAPEAAASAADQATRSILKGTVWDNFAAPESGVSNLYRDYDEVTGHLGTTTLDMPAWFEAEGLRAQDFLREDYLQVARENMTQAHGVVEMTQMFGDFNGEEAFRQVAEQARREGVSAQDIGRMQEAWVQLRDSTLGRDEIIDDPTALTTRVLRTGRHLNVAADMGKVVQMQAVDLGMLVQVAGFQRLLSAMELDWGKAAREVGGDISREMTEIYGLATEVSTMQRTASLTNEMVGSMTYKTKFEKFIAQTSRNIFAYGGVPMATDMMRRTAGILVTHDILGLAEQAKNGTISTQNLGKLRAFGIDRTQAAAIYDEWIRSVPEDQRIYKGFSDRSLRLGGTYNWQDLELRRKLVQAVRSNMDAVVLTPNPATKPTLMRREYMRALLLYQSFTIHAAQTLNLHLFQGTMASRRKAEMIASMVGMAWLVTQMRQPDYVEQDFEDSLAEAVLKSGILGIPGVAYERATEATGSMLGGEMLGLDPKPWAKEADPLGALGGPIYSQWQGLGKGVVNYATGEKEGNDDLARGLRYMLPYQNLWYASWLSSDLQKQLADSLE